MLECILDLQDSCSILPIDCFPYFMHPFSHVFRSNLVIRYMNHVEVPVHRQNADSKFAVAN